MNSARRRTAAAIILAVVGVTAGCTGSGSQDGRREQPLPKVQLVSALTPFAACDELEGYLRTEGARVVGPYGLDAGVFLAHGRSTDLAATDDGAAAPAASEAAAPSAAAGRDFSGTNVQEAGVDEPDLVKTDGRRLVTMARGTLQVIDLTGDSPGLAATIGVTEQHQPVELLMAGDRVLVLHSGGPAWTPAAEDARDSVATDEIGVPVAPQAQVTVVDISDLATPKVVAQLKLDGSLVSSRMIDGVARLVLRSGPPKLAFQRPSGTEESVQRAAQANRRLVESSSLDDWLPSYTYEEPGRPGASASGRLSDCREVSRPEQFSGLDMVSVVSLEAGDPRPGPAATVVGAGEIVYSSPRSLYVSTTRWVGEPGPLDRSAASPSPGPPGLSPGATTTEVHKFDISDKVRTRYVASGSVPGRVLNQFSLSELDGDLRVATTKDGISRGGDEADASESFVSVLRQDGTALVTVGSVGGLGKGERIYAVRFLGDRGYVVTFRQTDPLYVVDLSQPERPAVRGELKIPGYSAYLHPVGDHRLLGVGQEATDQGRTTGTQLSLFDVSDPASPKRLAHSVLDQGHSEAEFDHHAFLYWPKSGLAVLPIEFYGVVEEPLGRPGAAVPEAAQAFLGAVGFSVSDGSIKEVGRIRHRDGLAIRRSLVSGDAVLTVSEAGLLASDLDTLREKSWLQFR